VQKILIRDYEDWKLVKRYRGLTFTVFNLDIAVKKMEKSKTTILSSREQNKNSSLLISTIL
jgi:hypothetical protein